jgi:hypothetical protein
MRGYIELLIDLSEYVCSYWLLAVIHIPILAPETEVVKDSFVTLFPSSPDSTAIMYILTVSGPEYEISYSWHPMMECLDTFPITDYLLILHSIMHIIIICM